MTKRRGRAREKLFTSRRQINDFSEAKGKDALRFKTEFGFLNRLFLSKKCVNEFGIQLRGENRRSSVRVKSFETKSRLYYDLVLK